MLRQCVLLLLAVQAIPAQPVVVGTGRGMPFPIHLAPGQVTYLYARIDKEIPNLKAEGYPLPFTLGGVSLWIGAREPVRRMPLFSVEPVYPCRGNSPTSGCSPIAAVRFQVPFEFLTVDYSREVETGQIWIEVDGKRGVPISFDISLNGGELVTQCAGAFLPMFYFTVTCPPALLHADGTPTWQRRPRPGEVLTFYAYGLGIPVRGPTFTPPTSGQPAPPSTESWNFLGIPALRFVLDFRANARPSPRPGPRSSILVIEPLYAGPAPGEVGLYQVNFRLPEPPVPLTPCTEVESNVTISFAGSSLGIPFCMQTEP